MSKMHVEKSDKGSNKGRNFYIALGVCLIAVGAAAWTTYDGVMKFTTPDNYEEITNSVSSSQQSVTPNTPTATNVPGIIESKQTTAEVKKEQKPEEKQAEKDDTLIVYPIGNNITKKYSDTDPLYSKTLKDWRVHNGIDFGAKQGDKVKSITGGTVVDIYEDPSLGKTIVIKHNGDFIAYYSGLGNTTMVKKGDAVSSGQEIGSINDIPSETADGPHLHLSIKKGEKFIDPKTILEKNKK